MTHPEQTPTQTAEQTPAPTSLDARYGRTRTSTRRTRLLTWVSAGVFAVVLGAWVVWAGLLEAPAKFEARDTGYRVVSENEVEVQWEFSAQPGAAASCAVQALNSSFGIVGWKIVDVAPSAQRTRILTETVLTSELGVTGLIYRCWLT